MQTLRVFGLLHRQGVIQSDIKPANLHQGDNGVLHGASRPLTVPPASTLLQRDPAMLWRLLLVYWLLLLPK